MKFDFFSLSRFHMAAICFDIVARASPNLERRRRRRRERRRRRRRIRRERERRVRVKV